MGNQQDMAARIEEKANAKLKEKAASSEINIQDIRTSLRNALIVELAYEKYNKKLQSDAGRIVEALNDWETRFVFEAKREHPYAKLLDICRKVLEEKNIHFNFWDKVLGLIGLRRR